MKRASQRVTRFSKSYGNHEHLASFRLHEPSFFSPLFRFSFSFLVDLLRKWTWKEWCDAGDKQNDASSRSSWRGRRREDEKKRRGEEIDQVWEEWRGGEAARCMRMRDGIELKKSKRMDWKDGNWDGDGKGMQQKQKDEEMQRRLLIAAKRNNHSYWYFFAMRSISMDSPTVPHVDNAPVHPHSDFCLPIHTQLGKFERKLAELVGKLAKRRADIAHFDRIKFDTFQKKK